MVTKTFRTNRIEFNDFMCNYILNAISGEGYGIELNTDQEKLEFLAKTFKSEYGHESNYKYYGSTQDVLKNWIMGLPSSFNIDYENYRIIEIAKEVGSLHEYSSSRQADNIIANWFNMVAFKTIQLMNKHNISLR